LEKREAALAARAGELDRRWQALERDAPLVEERSRRLEEAEARLQADQDVVRRKIAEIELVTAQLNQRGADNDRRAAMVQAAEARLEALRVELGQQAQVQLEQKAKAEALEGELAARRQALAVKEAEVSGREQDLAGERVRLDERQASVQSAAVQLKALQEKLAAQDADVKAREAALTAERKALESAVREHREDLARLDRLRDALDGREAALATRAAEVDRRADELETRQAQLDQDRQRLATAEAELAAERDAARRTQEQFESGQTQLAARTATSEGQQSFLVALRARLERLRDELRLEAQSLTEQRARQQELEASLAEERKALDVRRAEVEALELSRGEERRQVEDRSVAVRSAAEAMREQQEELARRERALAERAALVESRTSEHADEAAVLRAKAAQLLEIQQRVEADRAALAAREQALGEAERARRELQEQLQRRSDELAERRRSADALASELAAKAEALAADRLRVDADLGATRQQLDARAAELEQSAAEVQSREAELDRRRDRLRATGRKIAAERKRRALAKARWDEEHRLAAEDLVRTRTELDEFRTEALDQAAEIGNVLPELEARSAAALERLAHAREQLRNHVTELHEFARQSQDDLETLRGQVQAETERMVEQQAVLAKARSDHRLAVTGFRQQLIDWQGRVAEMKSTLADDGTRLERKASELDEAARQIQQQASDLQAAEEQVARKRGEVEYHLSDMRDWFRRKLRELAEASPGRAGDDAAILPSGLAGFAHELDAAAPAGDADVVPITQDLDPGDRKLGELLQSLDLVDNETLTTLLLEARRQRRSLRQVLLASGKLTVYQMALIEAGNVEGLTVGPFGVIDRLRTTAAESVYRVIDPRAGALAGPVVLRHLSEGQMADAVRPDEFRQRFAALAGVRHPHVAATIEVLDINGRPAALQEWLAGVPSGDWPSLAASPGVWYRLSCQALLGLATAHQAGLVHGAITPASVVLSADGLVKLSGVGEPSWLSGADPNAAPADDLLALGRLAAGWSALTPRRKLARLPRPLPATVRAVLDRWNAGGFATAADVLEALDAAGADVPAGVETWERLMHFAGENATEGVAWRKSA
jgi:chromosome segregation ATPase